MTLQKNVSFGELVEQGHVRCACGRRATGFTEPVEWPQCDDPDCHAAEMIVRLQLKEAELREENRELRAELERYTR